VRVSVFLRDITLGVYRVLGQTVLLLSWYVSWVTVLRYIGWDEKQENTCTDSPDNCIHVPGFYPNTSSAIEVLLALLVR